MPDNEAQLHQQILALLDKPWYGYVTPGGDGKFIVETLRELTHHHNGYVREKAVIALALKRDISALGELLSCVNDWVKPIHLAAVDAVKTLLIDANIPAFIAHLPAIRLLGERTRYDHREFVHTIGHFLVNRDLPAVQRALNAPDSTLRKAALLTLIAQDTLHDEAALEAVLTNPDTSLRALAVRDWLQHNRSLSVDLQLRLLRDAAPRIRRDVLFYLDEHGQKPPEAVHHALLLDKNTLIQQRTRRMLEGEIEATAFWLDVIASEHFTVSQRRSALNGLSECRYSGLSALAQWAYAQNEPGLRKTALAILVNLEGEKAKPRLLECLADPALSLALAALRLLSRSSLHLTADDVQALLGNSALPSHQFIYWRLPHLLNKWDWLILLLRNHRLLTPVEQQTQRQIWVSRFNQSGISPTAGQREILATLLPLAPEMHEALTGYLP